MSSLTTDTVYEVHLREDDPEAGVESPVTGHKLDFFDSGVWVERENERDFFPYETVVVVKERPANQE